MATAPIPRIILLGDSGVGKTALIHRIQTGEFLEVTTPTIGAGVTKIEVDLDSKRYTLQIWDTAGQELYRSIIPIYFRGAAQAILVFAFNDPRSFRNLDSWRSEIKANVGADIAVVLVGSKYDLEPAVSEMTAKTYADQNELPLFFASSKTGQNVKQILNHIAVVQAATMTARVDAVVPIAASADESGACC
jgi:small GTP-binding protein